MAAASLCFVIVSQAASQSEWLMFPMNEMLTVRLGTALVLSGFAGGRGGCIVSFLDLWLDDLQRGSRIWKTPSPDTSE